MRTWIGASLLSSVLALALFGPLLFPRDPWAMDGLPLLWPAEDPAYPLGTDSLGRDLAAGIASGAWVSLLVGVSSAAVSLLIGVSMGTLAGFYRGRSEALVMRVTELFQTVPSFVLAVVIVALFGASLSTIIISVGVVSWPASARLTRAQVLRVSAREFVLAARALGMSDARLLVRHVLPNALPPVISVGTLAISNAILSAAGLSFLGLGDPQVLDWGSIIHEGREQLLDAWYICALPGLAIMVAVLGFNLLGDVLLERR
ncbi:MAG TPA: ABC transporter permease [Polyangiales bacterium]|nr:ABC transporter permease [Polyangiales bacterium]